jgi:hypothetical protein
MDKNRLIGGLIAAVMVLLWAAPGLVGVLLSEPPPTRRRAIRAVINAGISMALGGLLGVLSHSWAAAFFNGLTAKFLGVDPHVDPTIAAVVVAVVVTGLGPAMLDRLEKALGRKINEVTP